MRGDYMNLSEYRTLTLINNFEYNGYSFNRAVYYSKANVPKGYIFGLHMSAYISSGIPEDIKGIFRTHLRLVYRQMNGDGYPFLSEIPCTFQIQNQNIDIEVSQFEPVFFAGETSQVEIGVDNIALTSVIEGYLEHINTIMWMWAK